ncbi:MAG: DinB 2 protein [Dehalococcoidia bacterium]|nr:DinB 2 protein [Dehalococcoidia bacterium]
MKEFLSRAGVDYIERNTTLDPKAREEVKTLGLRSTPATVIDGKPILGYSPNEVARVLDLGIHIEPTQSPEALMRLLDRLLVACATSVRQMPDRYMETPTLDGSRTMARLAPHIFEFVDAIMVRIDTMKMPETKRRAWTSFQEIAGYGDDVLQRWRQWGPRQDERALKAVPPEGSVAWHYSGSRSGYEFLDYIGNHTTHHLRQFYFAMEKLGEKPTDRIPDSALPPEYVQTIIVADEVERERVASPATVDQPLTQTAGG